MMRSAAILALLLAANPCALAADWPQFRGPDGQGVYKGTDIPVEWGPEQNVVWKTSIPGKGWSSPIVWNGRIYLTTAVPTQPKQSTTDQLLRAICLDARDGKLLWDTEVFREEADKSPRPHPKNSHASPTSVTDGRRLYVHFGHQGTAALSLDGKLLWRNRELRYTPVHGNGGSPLLVNGELIFSADGADKQFVAALNATTGKLRWQTDRNSQSKRRFSFTTPVLSKIGNRAEIVSQASDFVAAYDPESGKELWRADYPAPGYSVIPQPALGHGLIFMSTGYDAPVLFALKPGATGGKAEVVWTLKKGAPNTPSPLLVGDELYSLSDNGLLSCVNALTGSVYWSERVPGAYSASPICANGKIYITNETGTGTVVEAGKEFRELGHGDLKEKTFATFAVADGGLYIRTETQLYRFGKK